MIRLFISETTPPFAEGLSVILNPDQSRYLAAVMRLSVDDTVSIFNGRDGEWGARLSEVGKKAVKLDLIEQTRPQPTGQGPILAVALIKRSALEYIVEKATELGAGTIQLLTTRRTNASHTNVERLVSIAKESAEQTERLDVPEILAPVKLDRFLAAAAFDRLIFGDENSTHEGTRETLPLLQALKTTAAVERSVILIGPEGGFDDDERLALRGRPDCIPVNLGPRILRADTAAISALTLYQAVVGDWR
ncbi:RNA methyltransferase, RsmE family protein [Asticcacaulis biprosthecium C19]|uniref:Ribosomal RNA small subunit methyltransferase E n=1 Tax=Asticcacaulis biprosthecium C19 TaxID=715226 RepID=F4QSY5_9CAUL|nr:16S rRNA (uracil(1498)-N(3))-methyltransferase [Asticcacaulis biprosthecium]EGF89855.1 RNA methyltransferase, RsmE family protein [Asticcacaulis biprosthecium C19]